MYIYTCQGVKQYIWLLAPCRPLFSTQRQRLTSADADYRDAYSMRQHVASSLKPSSTYHETKWKQHEIIGKYMLLTACIKSLESKPKLCGSSIHSGSVLSKNVTIKLDRPTYS